MWTLAQMMSACDDNGCSCHTSDDDDDDGRGGSSVDQQPVAGVRRLAVLSELTRGINQKLTGLKIKGNNNMIKRQVNLQKL